MVLYPMVVSMCPSLLAKFLSSFHHRMFHPLAPKKTKNSHKQNELARISKKLRYHTCPHTPAVLSHPGGSTAMEDVPPEDVVTPPSSPTPGNRNGVFQYLPPSGRAGGGHSSTARKDPFMFFTGRLPDEHGLPLDAGRAVLTEIESAGLPTLAGLQVRDECGNFCPPRPSLR